MTAPTLASSSRTQLAYRLEGVYPINFGVPPTSGDGKNLNMTSESLDYTVKNEMSKTIRSDRQVPSIVQLGASAQGGFNFELQYKEYDDLIEAVLQGDWVPHGAAGVSSDVGTVTLASGSITASVAPTGADAFTDLKKGQWFRFLPLSGASPAVKAYLASRPFRVSLTTAPTSTVIVLDPATPWDTAITTTSLPGGMIGSSYCVNAAKMRTFALEVGHRDIGRFRQYTGMTPSKMDLKLSSGAIVTGMFEFMGKSFNLLNTTTMGTATPSESFTPANATRGVWDVLEGGVSVSSTTYVKSADITIDNKIRAQDAVGVFGNAGVAAGTLNVTGKMQVYFADSTIYNKVLTGAASSFTLPILDVDGNGYIIHLPSTKYMAAKVATGGIDQDNMLDIDFATQLDPTSTSPTYQQTVVVFRVGV